MCPTPPPPPQPLIQYVGLHVASEREQDIIILVLSTNVARGILFWIMMWMTECDDRQDGERFFDDLQHTVKEQHQ